MFKYAQIDATGKCIAISQWSGEVEADNMISLADEDNVNLNDTYADGVWTPAPPPEPEEPQPDRITQLEQQLAQTNQDLAAVLEMILG